MKINNLEWFGLGVLTGSIGYWGLTQTTQQYYNYWNKLANNSGNDLDNENNNWGDATSGLPIEQILEVLM